MFQMESSATRDPCGTFEASNDMAAKYIYRSYGAFPNDKEIAVPSERTPEVSLNVTFCNLSIYQRL